MKNLLVKIKEQPPGKGYKWYYASDKNKKPLKPYQTGDTSGNTMAGKEVFVEDNHGCELFKHSYRYTDGLYISKEDCIVIKKL
jgi:hypothetical protein